MKNALHEEPGRFQSVSDIMSVPAAVRINGKKAITVNGIWAYVQRSDGMTIYRHNERTDRWDAYKVIIATNY